MNSPLLEALGAHADAGFGGSYSITDDGVVRCDACRAELRPGDVRLHTLRRMEGARDPADMIALCGLECPRCHQLGTAVIHYGPMATIEEATVLRDLDDRRPPDKDRVPT